MNFAKKCLLRFAAVLILATGLALQAQAGTIGGTNADWNNWTEVAGLPAARYGMAADVLNGSLYAVGGYNNAAKTNAYRFAGTNCITRESRAALRVYPTTHCE